jgi:hypothetical protein
MNAITDNSFHCCYCGKSFSGNIRCTADHLIPISKGGANNPYNKRNCCKHCNTQKGSSLPHEYLLYLIQDHTNAKNAATRYNLEIKIENVKYIIEYVNTAGAKIFRTEYRYVWFKRRYLKTMV